MRSVLIIALLCSVVSISFAQNDYKKASSIEGVRVIESRAFRGHYLRLDSRGFQGAAQGGGVVNVTNTFGTHVALKITKLPDGYYTIQSTFFKNRYLRMDGRQINSSSKAPGGVVNLQTKAASYEKFKIEKLSDGSYSIESVAFPGRFLTLNANPKPKNWSQGGGKVQVQNRAGSHERFNLLEKK